MKALQDEKIERQDPAQLDLEFDVNQDMQENADDAKSGKSDSREEPGSDQGQAVRFHAILQTSKKSPRNSSLRSCGSFSGLE